MVKGRSVTVPVGVFIGLNLTSLGLALLTWWMLAGGRGMLIGGLLCTQASIIFWLSALLVKHRALMQDMVEVAVDRVVAEVTQEREHAQITQLIRR